jgi:hypothetical protein
MTKLTSEQIETFANRPKVRKVAVWNFLGTVHHCGTYFNALSNLDLDEKLYKWNKETVRAIFEGIKLAANHD